MCLLPLMFAGAHAAARPPIEDFQGWTELSATYQVAPKWALTGFGEVRLGKNASQFDEALLSGGGIYSPWSWLSLGTGYLYLHADPNLSGLKHENRIYTEATFRIPLFYGFRLADRVRPEVRWLQTPNGALSLETYRNRVMLERPVSIDDKHFVPFLAWEKFYDTTVHDWGKTRYYGGVTAPITQDAGAQIYYMHQDNEFFRPFRKNVIGINFILNFGGVNGGHQSE